MKKVTYSGGNASKKTSKKVLNKVMPIKADDGKTLRGKWSAKNQNPNATWDHDKTKYDPNNIMPVQQDVANLQGGSLGKLGNMAVSTPNGVSPVDGWNGDQTGAYKYRNLIYEHRDAKGNIVSSKNYGYDYENAVAENSGGKWFDDNSTNPNLLNKLPESVAAQPAPPAQPVLNPTTAQPIQTHPLTPTDKLYSNLGKAQPMVAAPDGAYSQFDPKWRSDNFMTPEAMTTESDASKPKQETMPKDRHIALKLSSNDMIAGAIAAASGMIPDQIKKDNQNRNKIAYNPNPYGDGTQAIAEHGLEVEADEAALYAKHGMMILGEGGIKTYGKNAHSKPMRVSEGPSHKNGGMPMVINGKNVEIQGGEGVQQYPDDTTVVFGGMRMPNLGPETKGLAGKTFQSIAKNIAKEEEKNTKRMAIPAQQTEGLDPSNKFDSLALGSKQAMQIGFNMRSAALTEQKDHLRTIQEAMHNYANEAGIDHDKAHTMFGKNGFSIAETGKSTKGKKIKANFNILGDPEQETEMPHKAYVPKQPKNPYHPLDPLGKSYGSKALDTGVVPEIAPEVDPIWRRGMTDQDAQSNINVRHKLKATELPEMRSLADENKLNPTNFLSELSYLGKTPDQVLSQEYKPYLNNTYQVSFQDRRNANQSTFNELAKQLQATGSAASLAALAGQKYEADDRVNAEEFRANQGIYNAITNQNYNVLNDAAKFNANLKDQQYVRQAQAKSNTDAQRAQALASISNKIAQNKYENMNIRLTEQRSGFRWNPETKRMEWEGGDYQFQPYGSGQNYAANQSKVTKKYGPDGEYLGRDEIDYPDYQDNINQARAQKLQRRAFTKFGNSFKS